MKTAILPILALGLALAGAAAGPASAEGGSILCQREIDDLRRLVDQRANHLPPGQVAALRDRLRVAASTCNAEGASSGVTQGTIAATRRDIAAAIARVPPR